MGWSRACRAAMQEGRGAAGAAAPGTDTEQGLQAPSSPGTHPVCHIPLQTWLPVPRATETPFSFPLALPPLNPIVLCLSHLYYFNFSPISREGWGWGSRRARWQNCRVRGKSKHHFSMQNLLVWRGKVLLGEKDLEVVKWDWDDFEPLSVLSVE